MWCSATWTRSTTLPGATTVTQTRLIRHFNEQLLLPLPLVQDLAPDQYARLVEQLPVNSPIKIHTDTARHYPYGHLAAHVLGYVQSTHPSPDEIPDDGIKTFTFKKKIGKTGLERAFDGHLSGTPVGKSARRSRSAFRIPGSRVPRNRDAT